MGSAYTPGLTVSARTTITKTRRLPLKGSVLVNEGDWVGPNTTVARAELPGIMQTVKVAARLGIDPAEVPNVLLVKIGDTVERGQVIAKTKGLFGLFSADAKATTSGKVELVSGVTGNVGIREAPTPVDVAAYLPGRIAHKLEGEGVVIEARGALIQGIFGIGGERRAPLKIATKTHDTPLTDDLLTPDCVGKIVVGGSNITGAALQKAHEMGVIGLVVGGIVDTDLVAYLGYDIGVAITGHENIPLSLVLTEGFGDIAMAQRTFDLLKRLEGKSASICGATQIRAGVIRPEVIVADETADEAKSHGADTEAEPDFSLAIGTPIRIIREPYFGRLATVTALPPQLVVIGSGAEVRVLEARLNDTGENAVVPRANVEITAG